MVKCPYCEGEYTSEEITVDEIADDYVVFSCPKCKKILNVSYLP
jgi:NAD-dependent SIR2 family protein deacetylase